MYCIKCGRKLTDTRNLYICPYCGNQSNRNTNYNEPQRSWNYQMEYPQYQAQVPIAKKSSNFLFFLIPAIGAAVIIALLIYGGVIRFGSQAMAAEANYGTEYELALASQAMQAMASDNTWDTTEDGAVTLRVKDSTNHYSPYVHITKQGGGQEINEELKPTVYLPEQETETAVITPAPEPTVVPTQEPARPEPIVVPTQEPTNPEPTTAPEPATTEPTTAPEPQSEPVPDGNLTTGAIRYSPYTYTTEPFRSQQVIPSSSYEDITYMDLSRYSDEALRIARNEIYARHGRMFVMTDLQQYFNGCSWYLGLVSPEEFDAHETTWLSRLERRNIEYIVSIENTRAAQ